MTGKQTIKIQIRIPKIRRIHPPLLKHKPLPHLLILKMAPSLAHVYRHAIPITRLRPRPVRALRHHGVMQCRHVVLTGDLLTNPELVQGGQGGAEEVGLVGVGVAVEGGIDRPFDESQGGVEARGQAVADGAVEVVAEDEGVAVDGVFEDDGEADRVLVVDVLRVAEVGVCLGGVVGVAWLVSL